jgi:hypothetical protein
MGSSPDRSRTLFDDPEASVSASSPAPKSNATTRTVDAADVADGSILAPVTGRSDSANDPSPSKLVDQAIQWVMDDPYWAGHGQGTEVEPDEHGLDAVDSVVKDSSPRFDAGATPTGDYRVSGNDRVEAGGVSSNQSGAKPEVQLHIGRIAIEVHQPEPSVQTLQAPVVASKPSTPRRAGPSSDSHLRRLYLRGF